MKRRDLIDHLLRQGCFLNREGSRHSVYTNPLNGRSTSVPRHSEIKKYMVRKICRDLDIPGVPGA